LFLGVSRTSIMRGDLRIRGRGATPSRRGSANSLAAKGILTVESSFMTPESWLRVDNWWSDLFGVPRARLWREPVAIGMHVGLGDYPGVFVAARHDHVHVSLPEWVTVAHVHDLEAADPSDLAAQAFWRSWAPTEDMVVLGPAMHAFTDQEPDVGSGPHEVELVTVDDLGSLHEQVSEDDWEESGLAHADGLVHVVRHGERVVAAAHLAGFLGGACDVNVLVDPAARGRGLGAVVAASATRTAVRTHGLARWRARVDNAPSRALSRALDFEDHCTQLAVRPAG
jgi:GNAT superfamily N-acetyltransferase